MRLSVTVDPELLKRAMNVGGCHTKRETIEHALHALIQEHRCARTIRHAGQFQLTLSRESLKRLRRRAHNIQTDRLWERSPKVQRRLRKALKELKAGQTSSLKAFAKRHHLI